MNILVVNAGSSSHKLCLYSLKNDRPVSPLWKGTIDWSPSKPVLKAKNFQGVQVEEKLKSHDSRSGIERLLKSLWEGPTKVINGPSEINRIGHRVVHGGTLFEKPVQITSSVKKQIRKLIPLAPLHNPASLEEIELFESLFPSVVQVAVFDTTFHLTMCEQSKTYPIPKVWRDLGIQRFGFHGISHQYCAEQIAKLSKKKSLKIVNCHLGNGCSICAIDKGKSVATTMGFTPLEGLMMGTRSGSIDPGILFYLMQEKGYSAKDLDHELNFNSGLKAIAGTSNMQAILKNHEPASQLAFEMFIFRLKGFIGAMVAALGGIDVLSFTGGMGENSPLVREAACQGLEFLQLTLDMKLNQACQANQEISGSHSKVKIFVIYTEEEWMIARAAFQLKLSKI